MFHACVVTNVTPRSILHMNYSDNCESDARLSNPYGEQCVSKTKGITNKNHMEFLWKIKDP